MSSGWNPCSKCQTQEMLSGWKSANAIRLKRSKCHQAEIQQMPSSCNSANAVRLKFSKCQQAESQQMPSGVNSANAIRLKLSKCHQAESQQCHRTERALKLSSLIGLLLSYAVAIRKQRPCFFAAVRNDGTFLAQRRIRPEALGSQNHEG